MNASVLAALPAAYIGRKALPGISGGELTQVTNGSRLRSHKSPLLVFHKRCCQRDSTLGIPGSRVSKEYWARVRDEWSHLSEDQRAHYEEEVHLEKDTTARANVLDYTAQCASVSSALVSVVGKVSDEASTSLLLSIGGHDGQHAVCAPLAVQRYTDTVDQACGDLELLRWGWVETSFCLRFACSFF